MKLWFLEKENTKEHTYEIWVSFFEEKLRNVAAEDYRAQVAYDKTRGLLKNSNNDLAGKSKKAVISYDNQSVTWSMQSKEVGYIYFDISAFVKEKIKDKAKEHGVEDLHDLNDYYSSDSMYAKLKW